MLHGDLNIVLQMDSPTISSNISSTRQRVEHGQSSAEWRELKA